MAVLDLINDKPNKEAPQQAEAPLMIPNDAFFNKPNEILRDLEDPQEDLLKQNANQKQENVDWLNSKMGHEVVQNAHDQLMKAIENFDHLKGKNKDLKGPIDNNNHKILTLKSKHKNRVDLLINSPPGLKKIQKHIKEIIEFCEAALEKENLKEEELLEPEDLGVSVMNDLGKSIFRDLRNNHNDNLHEGLRNTIEYLGVYLAYLKPKLEDLLNMQNANKPEREQFLEARRQEEALQEIERKRKEEGKLTKEEALKVLVLQKGIVKKYQDEPGEFVDVESDLNNMVSKLKAQDHFKQVSQGKIQTIEDFNTALARIKDQINKAVDYYTPTDFYKLIVSLVEWLNDQKYKPAKTRKK